MLELHLILGTGYTDDEKQTLVKHVIENVGLAKPKSEVAELGTAYTWEIGCQDIREELRNKIFYLLQDHPITKAKGETWLVGYPD